MQLDSFDLVASLQTLPETDPVEIDGIQFGAEGGGAHTCAVLCFVALTIEPAATFCLAITCA